MKFIDKRNPPHDLHIWVQNQPRDIDGNPINVSYGDMPSQVKKVVREHLLQEQGYLCCYTGIRISEENSHIEHFKPQSKCDGQEDINYRNMFAAYPTGDGERALFGAHRKDDWWPEAHESHLLISPLEPSCERRFTFTLSGKVDPADASAAHTIEVLGLNEPELQRLRRSAIRAHLRLDEASTRKSGKHPITTSKLRQISEQFCQRNRHTSAFNEFCYVIQQAALEMITKREKQQQKEKYKNQKKRRK